MEVNQHAMAAQPKTMRMARVHFALICRNWDRRAATAAPISTGIENRKRYNSKLTRAISVPMALTIRPVTTPKQIASSVRKIPMKPCGLDNGGLSLKGARMMSRARKPNGDRHLIPPQTAYQPLYIRRLTPISNKAKSAIGDGLRTGC